MKKMTLLQKNLKKLMIANAVSGYEWELGITATIQGLVGYQGIRVGDNIVYELGTGDKTILLSAHMDEIGFFITNVNDRYGQIIPIGDVDITDVISTKLIFFDKGQSLPSKKIRVCKSFSSLKVYGLSKARMGMVGTFDKKVSFYKNIVIGPSLDNKVGCLALIELIKNLSDKKLNTKVIICFSCREEVGTNGLLNVVNRYRPDISIDVDSAYAKPLTNEYKNWSVPEIGKGPALQLLGKNFVMRSKNRRFIETLCQKNKISYQYEIPSSNDGGTNASSVSNLGFDIMQINIPVASQHTSKSKASLKDIKTTIRLLSKLVTESQ